MAALCILLIDDDERLHELLANYMKPYEVSLDWAPSGVRGLEAMERRSYDAVLLDIMMPGMDGMQVLERIRARTQVPVLMLTARGDEVDRVLGLELGADDYIHKPFSSRELLARLRAVIRRSQPQAANQELSVQGVVVQLESREVRVDAQVVELTGLEFDLLVALMQRAGRVIPRASLLQAVGRDDVAVGERTVDVHISKLRKKLGGDRIKTVRGVGYVLARERP